MIKVIIFDFDGVILESVDVKGWAFQELFKDHPGSRDRILTYHHQNGGVPRADKIRYILKEFLGLPHDDATVTQYCDRFGELVYRKVVDSPFVPGVREALEIFKGKRKMFVVSGTPHEEMNRIVEEKGLRKYFRNVYGSPVNKDEWTKRVLVENAVSPREALWIGDASSDFQAAKTHGIRFVLRSWIGNQDVFRNVPVDFKMNDLTGLPALVSRLDKEGGL
jgi:phosphoglycolate phosphatase-like HAD superfamily hydrolase